MHYWVIGVCQFHGGWCSQCTRCPGHMPCTDELAQALVGYTNAVSMLVDAQRVRQS